MIPAIIELPITDHAQDGLRCGAQEEMSGATCTRPAHPDERHSDLSSREIQITWITV